MTSKMYCILALIACLGLSASLSAQTEKPRKPLCESSWNLQGSVLFFQHPGGELTFQCDVEHPLRKFTEKTTCGSTPAILVTLYTPDEHIYKDFYWRDDNDALKHSFQCTVPDAQQGVWQIRVSMDEKSKFTYKVTTNPGKVEAVMPARCWFWHQDGGKIDNTFFMVPQNAAKPLHLTVFNCELEFLDLDGKSVAKFAKGGDVTLEPGKIYNYRNRTKAPGWNWSGYQNYPVIFCETAEVARKLNASLIAMPDGKLVPLGVSRRILEWKKTLKPEDLAVPAVDLMACKDAFLADEESRCLLEPIGPLAAAPYLLANQDINPDSPKFGSCPCDLGALALLYTLNKPYNPYYQCKGLLNRVALYYLDSATRYRPVLENGTLYEGSSYAGADGMIQIMECAAYSMLAPSLPENVREMWTEALGYPCRRFFSDRVSCENQTAHWPAKLFFYARGSGNDLFRQMATDYIRNLADVNKDRFIRTGYLQEAYGPDGSYIGISACLLSLYARISQDPEAYKLMDRIYTLMNHTVAPEPNNGKIYGSSGFAHRTPGGWYIRQYGGGSRLIADKLDSAACWHQAELQKKEPWDEETVTQKINWIKRNSLTHYRGREDWASNYAFGPYAHHWFCIPHLPVKKDAVLPVLSAETFDRNFNNEFLFFRRPGYYTGVYATSSATPNTTWNNDKIFGGKWTEKDGVMMHGSASGFSPLQGTLLFWTPQYGTALLSMNWNIYTQWNAWLKADGKPVSWPDYYSVNSTYDAAAKTILLQHKFRKSQASVERKLQFTDSELKVSVTVSGELGGAKFVEQLPYLDKKGMALHFCIDGNWQDAPAAGVTAIRWTNADNATVTVAFEQPVTVRKSITSESQTVRIASLEVEAAGNTLAYTVR